MKPENCGNVIQEAEEQHSFPFCPYCWQGSDWELRRTWRHLSPVCVHSNYIKLLSLWSLSSFYFLSFTHNTLMLRRFKSGGNQINVGTETDLKINKKRLWWRKGRKGRETGNCEEVALTFFGVTGCILAGVANHPIQVPGSVFQHVIPGKHEMHTQKQDTCYMHIYVYMLHTWIDNRDKKWKEKC